MMKKIVSNLKFNEKNQLVCKGRNGKFCPVFKKQGSLDGACATYSVVMNLLILSVISDTDTKIYAEHKTRDIKKLFKVFCNDHGMHREGQTFYKIQNMLLDSFGKVIDVKHTCTKCSAWETLDRIVTIIKNDDKPVIVSVHNNYMCHAMLAVGYEKDDDKITRLFLLDPGGDYIHGRKRWNAEIQVNKERKNPFSYISSTDGIKSKSYVELDDILILSRL